MLDAIRTFLSPNGPIGFDSELWMMIMLAGFITVKGLYHARIYRLGNKTISDIGPAWLHKYSEQHFVSIASDVFVYGGLLVAGASMLVIFGTAYLMYATSFNGCIQLATTGTFWGRGPKDWPLEIGPWSIRIPRKWRNRKAKAILGAACLVIGLILAPR